MRIMIADDHPLFAEGLRNLLYSNDFEIVGIVNDGEKAVEDALKKKPDLLLMDIEMPFINGIEATKKIKSEFPAIKIIILTSFEEKDSLIKAIKAGASGYLLKSLDGEELIRSLKEIEVGKNPFSPGLEDCLLNEIRQADDNCKKVDGNSSKEEKIKVMTGDIMSERQVQVVRHLTEGLTYQEIGKKLFLSERTIKYHIEQIKEKTGLKTQAQIIAYGKEKLGLG